MIKKSSIAKAGSKKKLLRFKVTWRDEVTKKYVRTQDGNMMLKKTPLAEVIPEDFNKEGEKKVGVAGGGATSGTAQHDSQPSLHSFKSKSSSSVFTETSAEIGTSSSKAA